MAAGLCAAGGLFTACGSTGTELLLEQPGTVSLVGLECLDVPKQHAFWKASSVARADVDDSGRFELPTGASVIVLNSKHGPAGWVFDPNSGLILALDEEAARLGSARAATSTERRELLDGEDVAGFYDCVTPLPE